MTSTNSNIWKRFLFNNQHTTYNKDIIQYHLEYNNDNEKEENQLEENTSNINIEQIFIQYLDTIIILCLLGMFSFRRYF